MSESGVFSTLCGGQIGKFRIVNIQKDKHMTMQEKINELLALREKARTAGGEKRIEKQHAQGKYTARERIAKFLDEGSFEEFDMFATHRCHNFGMEKDTPLTDGVITGYGTVDGRLVFVYSQDFTVSGGSLSETVANKICKVLDQAMKMAHPSSVSTTPAAPASRKASTPSPATPRSSSATSSPRASCRKFPPSSAPAPAAPSIPPPSPTSS